MPVATAAKVEALSVDFRSQSALAEILGVSRSRVTRWLKGAGIDPLNAEKVDLLELVWSNLLRVYEPEAARAWLWGVNPLLSDRRPIDLVRAGRAEELMRAIRAERADSFACSSTAASPGTSAPCPSRPTRRSGSRASSRATAATTTPTSTAASI